MDRLWLLRGVFLLGAIALVGTEAARGPNHGSLGRPSRLALTSLATANILFMAFLWLNHAAFPLNLDLMEGTVLQHVQRAAGGLSIYPEPSPAYVPLAYNPLYYVVAVPFTWVFGVNLFTLRLVSILGTLGSGLILYRVVREQTGSPWWGWIAAGCFAAAYRVMDAYLDSAHSDSCMLFAAMLGTYVIHRNRSRAWNMIGVLILVGAFWFKQHGALFAIGGVLFLTWKEGLRRAWPYWLVATLLGPALYVWGGPALFGSHFHYFTWEVPSQWTEPRIRSFGRYGVFILTSYPALALAAGTWVLWTLARNRERFDVWQAQFVCAAVTGLVGTLDRTSADNVYIPMGTWFILTGAVALHAVAGRVPAFGRYRIAVIGLLLTFGAFLFDPLSLLASRRADQRYTELVTYLRGLPGSVYAPWIGQLQHGYTFFPAAHWVALEDMERGPGRATDDHAVFRTYLAPALHPEGPAFVLANFPLHSYPFLAFLNRSYVLDADLGTRFEDLRVLPKRFDHGWPRYLYRYAAERAVPLSAAVR